MASTREILKALNKLEDDRKSDLLCSPDARREEYHQQLQEAGVKLVKLLETCPKCENDDGIITYGLAKQTKTWYNEFRIVFEQYNFIRLVISLDCLD